MLRNVFQKLFILIHVYLLATVVNASSIGDAAPAIKLPFLEKQSEFALDQLRGKVVYLDFWASWCGSCRISLPLLDDLREELAPQGFEVVGVNVDAKPKDGSKFLQKYPVSFPVLSDPEGKTPALYRLKGMPTSYLIDKKGVIRKVHVGFKKGDMVDIRQQVLSLLAE